MRDARYGNPLLLFLRGLYLLFKQGPDPRRGALGAAAFWSTMTGLGLVALVLVLLLWPVLAAGWLVRRRKLARIDASPACTALYFFSPRRIRQVSMSPDAETCAEVALHHAYYGTLEQLWAPERGGPVELRAGRVGHTPPQAWNALAHLVNQPMPGRDPSRLPNPSRVEIEKLSDLGGVFIIALMGVPRELAREVDDAMNRVHDTARDGLAGAVGYLGVATVEARGGADVEFPEALRLMLYKNWSAVHSAGWQRLDVGPHLEYRWKMRHKHHSTRRTVALYLFDPLPEFVAPELEHLGWLDKALHRGLTDVMEERVAWQYHATLRANAGKITGEQPPGARAKEKSGLDRLAYWVRHHSYGLDSSLMPQTWVRRMRQGAKIRTPVMGVMLHPITKLLAADLHRRFKKDAALGYIGLCTLDLAGDAPLPAFQLGLRYVKLYGEHFEPGWSDVKRR